MKDASSVGKKAHLVVEIERSGGNESYYLEFPVKIKEHKYKFGKHFFFVAPLEGKGEAWVMGDKLK